MDLTSKLAEIARGRLKSTPGGTVVTGRTLGRLDAGTHDVRIESVNTSCLGTRGFVDLTYGDAQQRTHRDRIWVLNRDGTTLSWRMQQLAGALFGCTNAWLAAVEQDQEQAFHLLRGMKLTITMEPGPGYQVEQSPVGWQAVLSGQVVAGAQTIQETHRQAQAAGHSRSWLRVKGVTGGRHLDDNQQALSNATAALRSAGEEAEPVSLESHLRSLGAD